MDKDLRNAIICFLIVILGWIVFWFSVKDDEKMYCGIVIEKYRVLAGYKVKEQPRIVFYNDSLKRNIDVKVSYDTYSNTKVRESVCFHLRELHFD